MSENSILNFYRDIEERNLISKQIKNVLEIGCGCNSLFENFENNFDVLAIDNSVDQILSAPDSKINYQISTIENFSSNQKYDLIVDAHCLHCIIDPKNRIKALENIFDLLADDGQFISEMMSLPSNHFQNFSFKNRVVKDAFEIENELLAIGFKIKYFKIDSNFYFLDDFEKELKCDLLRIVCSK